MLARQRQEAILQGIADDGGVRISKLVETLGVSDMTVRRDIDFLAGKGLLYKVHGGAIAVGDHPIDEPGFSVKSGINPIEKSEIARTAASLISPGQSVAVSAGTTAYAVAVELRSVKRLTVITNSPRVAELLYDPTRDDQTIVQTGGVRTPSDALSGPVATRMLSDIHVDTLILGVHGIDLGSGLTTPNMLEAETNRALITAAKRIIVVADHSKWGVVGLCRIATLDQVDILVTDHQLDVDARRYVSEQVGQLIVASSMDAG